MLPRSPLRARVTAGETIELRPVAQVQTDRAPNATGGTAKLEARVKPREKLRCDQVASRERKFDTNFRLAEGFSKASPAATRVRAVPATQRHFK